MTTPDGGPTIPQLPSFHGLQNLPNVSIPITRKGSNGGAALKAFLQALPGPGNAQGIGTGNIAKYILQNTNAPNAAPSSKTVNPDGYSLWNRVSDLLGAPSDVFASLTSGALKGHTESSSDNAIADILKSIGGAAVEGGKAVGRVAQPLLTNNPILPDAIEPNHTQREDWVKFMMEQGPNAETFANPGAFSSGYAKNANGTFDYNTPSGKTYATDPEALAELQRAEGIKGIIMDITMDPLNLVTGGAGIASKFKAFNAARNAKAADDVLTAGNSLDALKDLNKATNQTPINPQSLNQASPVPVQTSGSQGLKLNPNQIIDQPSGIGTAARSQDLINSILNNENKMQVIPKVTGVKSGINPIESGSPVGASNGLGAAPGTGGLTIPPRPSYPPNMPGLGALAPKMSAAKKPFNEDLFNSMLGSSKAEAVANAVQTGPNHSLELAGMLSNDTRRGEIANAILDKIKASTTSIGFSKGILADLNSKAVQGMKYTHTKAYLERIADQVGTFNRLRTEPAAQQKFVSVLSKVMKMDHDASPLGHAINSAQNGIETGKFPGIRDQEAFNSAIASGKNVRWSGPKQVNMWNTILGKLPYSGTKKFEHAHAILQNAEQHFIDAGHIPYSASKSSQSVPLRLSNVIAKIGPTEFAKHGEYATTLLRSAFAGPENVIKGVEAARSAAPKLAVAIDNAVRDEKAASAIAQAPAVKEGVETGDAVAKMATQSLQSDARKTGDVTIASKLAEDIARNSGAGQGGAKLASAVVKHMYLNQNKVQSAITSSAINTFAILNSGKISAKTSSASKVSRAIQATIGGPSVASLGSAIGPDANAMEWLGARFGAAYNLFGTGTSKLGDFLGPLFNPAYNNPEMRPLYLQEIATARATVAARTKVWNNTVRQFGSNPDMWSKAIQSAQGGLPTVPGSPEEQLSQIWKMQLENLFGSSGLRKGAALDNSIAGRGQLTLDELNKSLKRYGLGHFSFTRDENVIDSLGRTHNFSKGTDWLNSWESWNITDPQKFMLRLSNAVENTTREAKMFEEIGERFGGIGKKAGKGVSVNQPRLGGYYFSSDHAKQIQQFMRNLDDAKKPNSKLMQHLDKVISKWKTSVTIYMPSHHIRNAVGDTYMNWLAGVNSVQPYGDALKVMRSQKGRYKDMVDVENLVTPNAVQKATARGNIMHTLSPQMPKALGHQIVFTMKNGQHVTNDMLYTSAFQKGILPAAHVLEDIPEEDAIGIGSRLTHPFGGKVRNAVGSASEYREHFIRLAHYSDSMRKSAKSFEAASFDAAGEVRKWHPDGMDLTRFEKIAMRRAFPFYSWTRKAFPAIVESIVASPGKTLLYPKAMYYGPQLSGSIDQQQAGPSLGDPFPIDQLFPNWLRESGIPPIMGGPGDYTEVNPSNPSLDIINQVGNPRNTIGSMLNPLLRIPAEQVTGTTVTGAPITNQQNYAINQIPGASVVGRVTNFTNPNQPNGINAEKLLNLLTAAGIQNTGNYQKEASYDLRDYLKAKALKVQQDKGLRK